MIFTDFFTLFLCIFHKILFPPPPRRPSAVTPLTAADHPPRKPSVYRL